MVSKDVVAVVVGAAATRAEGEVDFEGGAAAAVAEKCTEVVVVVVAAAVTGHRGGARAGE